VSRLSKTASAAIAALVVSGAAAVVPLLVPRDSDDAAAGSPAASASSATPTGVLGDAGLSGTAVDRASGLPAAGADPAAGPAHTVLFLGDAPALRPRGGVARSFACRAADSLRWRCLVRSRVAPGGVPSSLRADVVVLVMSAADDATSLRAQLEALPPTLRDARVVILAPVAVTATKAVAAHLPGVRALAAARGADVIDPVGQHWLTAATRRTDLAADGRQLTAAGHQRLAGLLAGALTAVRA
jgi:hypothetical protein